MDAHLKYLADDLLEGRAPATRGGRLAATYIAAQFEALGLEPAGPDGSYFQPVALVGLMPHPSLVWGKGGAPRALKYRDDFVAWAERPESHIVADGDVVFVGYGITATEWRWDDYKDADLRGKVLLMLVNTPGLVDSTVFNGRALTYYGRWTYKLEEAARRGALGAILVHTTPSATYGWDVVRGSWSVEQFQLDRAAAPSLAFAAWVTHDAAQAALAPAGLSLDSLTQAAARRSFRPVATGLHVAVEIASALRHVKSENVVARVRGSDATLARQAVVFTAHWDHKGIGPAVNGDSIYNGAEDNASGTGGMLEIAHAFAKLPAPPKRSILFLAVTAEEQGLLGSEYYTVAPIYPLAKTAANINLDGLNVHGRTRDLTLIGYGASDLDDYVRDAAGEQGRTIRPDAEPEKGHYYRSDHFNFAKQGVPALHPDDGVDFIGRPADFGRRVRDDYTQHDYHKPSDVVKPDWDLSGAREDLKLFFAVGYRVAGADTLPGWKPGNEFKARRDAQLKAASAH